jgi:hypothetical protein
MNAAGWICVGVVAWFVVSVGLGLLVGAAIIRASAEQARSWAWEAIAADRSAIGRSPAMDAVASRAGVESRSSAVRPDAGPARGSNR